MSESNQELDGADGAPPSTSPDSDPSGGTSPSTKRVNWEIGDDAIVKVLVHAAVLRQRPGPLVTELIKKYLNDFSITDQRKARATRTRKIAAKSTPTESAKSADPVTESVAA